MKDWIQNHSPITIEIYSIDNTDRTRYIERILLFNENNVFDYLNIKLPIEIDNNYYTWLAIQVKRYLKEFYNVKDTVSCWFYNYYCGETGIRAGSIGINCNSDLPLDYIFIP